MPLTGVRELQCPGGLWVQSKADGESLAIADADPNSIDAVAVTHHHKTIRARL